MGMKTNLFLVAISSEVRLCTGLIHYILVSALQAKARCNELDPYTCIQEVVIDTYEHLYSRHKPTTSIIYE